MLKNSDDFAITNNGVLMFEGESLTSPTDKILIEVAKEGLSVFFLSIGIQRRLTGSGKQ